ncbi:uncharacterized protein [Typha latifolia]|uniref:uncharacterized protein n=1 Tax=Typha latifolia TaxID=4733 RepID=UPI003C2C618A
MTLEDFFTLTEMKNGLATLARVEELISIMKNQRACIVNNVADVARQWSTCAGTLAATDKMDCLSHFVELNGLCFLNQWLQESLTCNNDDDDDTIDDLVNEILRSLERLPLEREMPSVSEISVTVEKLLNHKNHNIKEKARTLLEMWNSATIGDLGCQNQENIRSCQEEQKPPFDKNTSEEGNCKVQSADSDLCNSKITGLSGSSHLCAVVEGKTYVPNQIMLTSGSSAGASDTNTFVPGDTQSTCQEILKESSLGAGKNSTSICAASNDNLKSDDPHEDLALEDGVKDVNVQLKTEEKSTYKASLDIALSPSGKAVMESIIPCNTDSKEIMPCKTKNEELQLISVGASCRLPKNLRNTKELNSVLNVRRDVVDVSGSFRLTKRDGSRSAFKRQEATKVDGESKDLQSEGCLRTSKKINRVIPCVSSKPVDKVSSVIEQRADMELESGEIDALEVARQVAIEVEREVVDYREPFCSSSPDISAGVLDSHLPDVVDGKEEPERTEEYGNEMTTGNDSSDSDSNHKNGSSLKSEKVDTSAEKNEQETDSTEMTTRVKEIDSEIDKNKFDFDLNEDVSTEDNLNPALSNQVNLSTPVAVSALKGIPELTVRRLQSESTVGWRGSAPTSAFRPASPRRTPDGRNTYSGSKQEKSILEIDLNLSGNENNLAADPTSMKPPQRDYFSRSSSVEVSPRRADKLSLDLNRLGNEDATYPSSLHWNIHHENGDQSLFSTSSSFSRHPSERDFDLNDKPSSVDIGGSQNLSKPFSKSLSMFSCPKLDDPATSIGASRIAVETKDSACQTPHPYSLNGLSVESTVPARPFHPYAYMPPHAYGLNGQPTWAYTPAVYGSGVIPYMVDSRGTTVVPQILGTTASVPPFLMSMTSAPQLSTGIASSQSSLDLNSSMTVERGSREAGGLFQFLAPAQTSRADVHTMGASQPSSSGGTLKRKEPDCGWEPCTLGYKQVTSWQ